MSKLLTLVFLLFTYSSFGNGIELSGVKGQTISKIKSHLWVHGVNKELDESFLFHGQIIPNLIQDDAKEEISFQDNRSPSNIIEDEVSVKSSGKFAYTEQLLTAIEIVENR